MSSDLAPQARHGSGAIWTGSEVFLWGGVSKSDGNMVVKGDGSRYDPNSDSWTTISSLNAPSARSGHITVMGLEHVYVWGGSSDAGTLDDGAFYDPLNDAWTPFPQAGAPSPREKFGGVWINDKLMVWGGFDGSSSLNDGAIFDPGSGLWSEVSVTNAPSPRHDHNMVWLGDKVLVWGGLNSADGLALASGALYDPENDTWADINMVNAPSARYLASGVWTGKDFMIWGGRTDDASPFLNTGGIYSPATDTWQQLPAYSSLFGRSSHGAVWTDKSVLMWGGKGLGSVFSDGAQYGFPVDETESSEDL
ncbi:MAG: Kelch repeat-containing protein [Oligoflexales bacterium]